MPMLTDPTPVSSSYAVKGTDGPTLALMHSTPVSTTPTYFYSPAYSNRLLVLVVHSVQPETEECAFSVKCDGDWMSFACQARYVIWGYVVVTQIHYKANPKEGGNAILISSAPDMRAQRTIAMAASFEGVSALNDTRFGHVYNTTGINPRADVTFRGNCLNVQAATRFNAAGYWREIHDQLEIMEVASTATRGVLGSKIYGAGINQDAGWYANTKTHLTAATATFEPADFDDGLYGVVIETSAFSVLGGVSVETSAPPVVGGIAIETSLPPALVTGRWGYSGTVTGSLVVPTTSTRSVSGRWGYYGRASGLLAPYVVTTYDYYVGCSYCRTGILLETDIAALRAQGFRVELIDTAAGHTWVTISGPLSATIAARESIVWHSRPTWFFGPVPNGTVLTESFLRQWAPRGRVMGIW